MSIGTRPISARDKHAYGEIPICIYLSSRFIYLRPHPRLGLPLYTFPYVLGRVQGVARQTGDTCSMAAELILGVDETIDQVRLEQTKKELIRLPEQETPRQVGLQHSRTVEIR